MLQIISKIQTDYRQPLWGLKMINDRLKLKKDMIVVGTSVGDKKVLRTEKILLRFAKGGSGVMFKTLQEPQGLLRETTEAFRNTLYKSKRPWRGKSLKKMLVHKDSVGVFHTLRRMYLRNTKYISKGHFGYSVFLSRRLAKIGDVTLTVRGSLFSQVKMLQSIS